MLGLSTRQLVDKARRLALKTTAADVLDAAERDYRGTSPAEVDEG